MTTTRIDTFAALRDALADVTSLAAGLALYPSSGTDTRALTFTHPGFLRDRGVPEVPACGLYLFVDRHTPRHGEDAALGYRDDATEIETTSVEPIALCGLEAHLLRVAFRSTSRADRALAVVRVRADNERVAPVLHRERVVPDLFIGVTDGCRFGGNRHCVNHLTTRGVSAEQARRIPVPRWWITDHFYNTVALPDPSPAGTLVVSRSRRFPWAFRKRAMLSSRWGTYRERPIGGATLFEREPAPHSHSGSGVST